MNWPTWLEPAAWVFLGVLAAEVASLGVLAWRAPHRMAVQRWTVQVRQAIEDVADAAEDRAKAADARQAELVDLLEEIRDTLFRIDARGAEVVDRHG